MSATVDEGKAGEEDAGPQGRGTVQWRSEVAGPFAICAEQGRGRGYLSPDCRQWLPRKGQQKIIHTYYRHVWEIGNPAIVACNLGGTVLRTLVEFTGQIKDRKEPWTPTQKTEKLRTKISVLIWIYFI